MEVEAKFRASKLTITVNNLQKPPIEVYCYDCGVLKSRIFQGFQM
jgi:hypothetical protein